ncbi:MAG: septal ring lytic transglycosylase RlpA family protein [Deltaproteobacteria bacterium]|nr:septal ring lytic transglycosylase RlpA family protein [Deltaproteobacteria bacterium]
MNRQNRVSLFLILVACTLVLLYLHGCTRVRPLPGPPSKPPAKAPGQPRPYKVMGKWYQPLPHARGFQQKGIASWYGKKFHGRKTSSGEIYNMYAVTAAHKTLPLGTYVRVHNLKNHKKIDVRINDRGPFVRGRIIDLSYGAAKKMGIVGAGTAPVEIIALGRPMAQKSTTATAPAYMPIDFYSINFTIQVGAFSNPGNAAKLKLKLSRIYENAHVVNDQHEKKAPFKVRVGTCSTLDQAAKYETRLIQNGFPDAFIIAE